MNRPAAKAERWIVLAAGVGVMLTVGAAFSWSVYTHPLMAFFRWSSLSVALVFALFSFFFGAGAIAGGYLHDRFGPRGAVLLGACLWGAAGILAGLGLRHLGLPWIDVTYGLLGGFACGMMYVVPGATAAKWFPEERGLANGVILSGFGLGALVFNLIAGSFPAVRELADASTHVIAARDAAVAAGSAFQLPPGMRHHNVDVIEGLFVWAGLAYLIVGALCALVLHSPPAGYTVPKAAAKLAHERNFTPREVMRTRSFYLIWLMLFVDATCGLALFSNAVPIYAKVGSMTAAAATIAFGAVSATNGLGRLLWAWLSDFTGRMSALTICFVLEGAGLIWMAHVNGPTPAALSFAIVLLCFGGIFAIMPAVMADFFGTRFFGEDYSLVITAASFAGLAGPLLVAGLEDTLGSLTAWLTPIGIVLLLTAVLPMVTRDPTSTTS